MNRVPAISRPTRDAGALYAVGPLEELRHRRARRIARRAQLEHVVRQRIAEPPGLCRLPGGRQLVGLVGHRPGRDGRRSRRAVAAEEGHRDAPVVEHRDRDRRLIADGDQVARRGGEELDPRSEQQRALGAPGLLVHRRRVIAQGARAHGHRERRRLALRRTGLRALRRAPGSARSGPPCSEGCTRLMCRAMAARTRSSESTAARAGAGSSTAWKRAKLVSIPGKSVVGSPLSAGGTATSRRTWSQTRPQRRGIALALRTVLRPALGGDRRIGAALEHVVAADVERHRAWHRPARAAEAARRAVEHERLPGAEAVGRRAREAHRVAGQVERLARQDARHLVVSMPVARRARPHRDDHLRPEGANHARPCRGESNPAASA